LLVWLANALKQCEIMAQNRTICK